MKVRNLSLAVSVCALLIAEMSEAQHKIQNSVFSNGGAVIASGSLRMAGTSGQPLIGKTNNQSNIIESGFWAQTIDLTTSVERLPSETIPKDFRLYPNYPNPFNPVTTIRFDLPRRSFVTLQLYDLFGRQVAILVDENLQPGEYKVEFDAKGLVSGVYIYRLKAEGFVQSRKLTLIK